MKRVSQRGMYNAVADINVVPMMDLVFNLLIVFMLATPLLEQSINIKLPAAKSATELNPKEFTTVSLDSAGHIYLGEKRVTLPELENLLRTKIHADPQHAVLIRGDKNGNYGKSVEIIDRLRLVGVTKFGLATTGKNL